MPRKYAGPLQPGKRSARVNKPRKPRGGKKDHLSKTEKKEVKKIIANKKETRYCGNWITYDDYPVPAGNLQLTRTSAITLPGINPVANNVCNMLGFQTGQYLNNQSTEINTQVGGGTMVALGGYGIQQGTDSTDILGDYAYLQSAKVDLQITALPWNTNDGTIYSAGMSGLQFRVLHVQSKNLATGVVPSYVNSFFWDRTHDKTGLTMAGTVKEIMEDFHLNTDQFIVHKDIKFRLTQPQHPAGLDTLIIQQNDQPTATVQHFVNTAFQGQATNPTYPCAKNLTLWMPRSKRKIRFSENDNGTTNAFEPTNYNFINMIFILCVRTCQQQTIPANNSVSRAWSAKCSGETRYRDA